MAHRTRSFPPSSPDLIRGSPAARFGAVPKRKDPYQKQRLEDCRIKSGNDGVFGAGPHNLSVIPDLRAGELRPG